MMRDTFINELTKLAENDKNVVLLTADLGFGVFEEFEIRFPGQYFNVGIAEQNMMGVASGLSLEGKKVVAYSIGNFASLRCLEQIRNDACYHDANITIVASGGGFSYGSLGMSHHTTEDLAILRSLPNISVVAPCTAYEAGEAISVMVKAGGVGYLRLDKTAAQDAGSAVPFVIGKSTRHKEGRDISLIAIGGILNEVNVAAVKLKNLGVDARVIGMHSIKPIDMAEIIDATNNTGGIVTVEEHNKDGGLGSAVSEVCMDYGIMPKRFLRIGLENIYSSIVGSPNYLRSRYDMDSDAIVTKIKCLLKL
jgi:transketolase